MRTRNYGRLEFERPLSMQRPIGMQQQFAALAANRVVIVQKGAIKKATYSLLANQAVYDGGAAYFDTGSYGTVTGTPSATTRAIGWFLQPPASSASAQNVGVELFTEIDVSYWESVTGGNAVASTNMFAPMYWKDNHTLSTSSGDGSVAGRLVAFAPQGSFGSTGVVGICRYSADILL